MAEAPRTKHRDALANTWGSPAEEELADTFSLDEWLLTRPEAMVLLPVRSESMLDAGIRPGDTVLLERGRSPKSGDVVLAEVDGEWMLRQYEKQGERVRLVPANARLEPVEPSESLRVVGVVTAVVRKYY